MKEIKDEQVMVGCRRQWSILSKCQTDKFDSERNGNWYAEDRKNLLRMYARIPKQLIIFYFTFHTILLLSLKSLTIIMCNFISSFYIYFHFIYLLTYSSCFSSTTLFVLITPEELYSIFYNKTSEDVLQVSCTNLQGKKDISWSFFCPFWPVFTFAALLIAKWKHVYCYY